MWREWTNYLPDFKTFVYMAFAFVIPLMVTFINMKLHKLGDPSWKKKDGAKNYKNKGR
ncbi:hypothetical protein [Virgibacillus salexigens]|uniref:Uncharacterized protein n=2 Tax=Virgibacillus TaxID=84406 RepID=A0A024QGK2_9BACI|nr:MULTISPECIES: hypothetical protein [Virgibacillus]MYL43188.1 hypothetical protein [Virgibacillus massiliensis]GGJ64275.1 hypothetical protein GCM10007111_27640 [Virgibacillus kapii]CDQ41683.1 hypothetical protein BN990_04057 [Virgibacillus massiliensis]